MPKNGLSTAAISPVCSCGCSANRENRQLMESCKRLYEYSYLISRIRFHLDHGLTLAKAIVDCLDKGVLVEYLTKHRSKVTMSILTEYKNTMKNRY